MRGWFVVAAFSGLFVWACSSDPASTPDAGSDGNDGGSDANAKPDTSGTDAGTDGAPSESCEPTPSTDPGATYCIVSSYDCPSCAKAGAGAIRYRCGTYLDGGTVGQPIARTPDGGTERLAGCTRIGLGDYCCPSGCVESMPDDTDAGNPFCPPTKTRSFVCPANAKGESTLAVPPGCEARPAVEGADYAALCCD